MISYLQKYFNPRAIISGFFFLLSGQTILAITDLFIFAKPAEIAQFTSYVFVTLGASIVLLYVIRENLKWTHVQPANFLISALIILLLIHPTSPIWTPLVALALLVGLKYTRKTIASIFNPAALVLVATYYVTGTSTIISWWGADLQQKFLENVPLLEFLVPAGMLLGFVYFAVKFKKQLYIGSFVATLVFLLLYQQLQSVNSSYGVIEFLTTSMFNSFAFFLLVMLAEPKTSPVKIPEQLLFGIGGGMLLYFTTYASEGPLLGLFPLPFMMTLLVMNAAYFAWKKALQ